VGDGSGSLLGELDGGGLMIRRSEEGRKVSFEDEGRRDDGGNEVGDEPFARGKREP